jgi:nitroreductase
MTDDEPLSTRRPTMELWDVFEKRRTIRRFVSPPSEAQLKRLLKAGSLAPSAGNKQAWFVVVINDPATRERLGTIKHAENAVFTPDTLKGRTLLQAQKEVFRNSTSLMVYTFTPVEKDPHRYDLGSAWLFAENLCLAAVPEGLGTQMFAYWDDCEKEVNRILGVPDKYRQVIGINVGVPDPDYAPPQKAYKAESKWIFRERWKAAD